MFNEFLIAFILIRKEIYLCVIILKRNPDGEISYEELIDGLRTGNEEEFKKSVSGSERARAFGVF